MIYRYETHFHTSPVSACADATVRESLEFYRSLGYDGVFLTNHFIEGNIRCEKTLPFEEKINFFFSDYEEALKIGPELGLRVFGGVEASHGGTDFLIYGLEKSWFLSHPEIETMRKSQALTLYMQSGALVIQAHPFREAGYIDHIRLYPRCVHGVEIINANRTDFENEMARQYAKNYGLLEFAGSDNHIAGAQRKLAGMCSETPVTDVQDFIRKVKNGEMKVFTLDRG